MEITFRFYKDLAGKNILKSSIFDTRGGLDNLIVGLDWTEVGTNDRLLHQLLHLLIGSSD